MPIYRLGQDHHGIMVRERFKKSTIKTKAARIQATSPKLPIIKIRHKQTGKCPPAAFVYRFFVLYFPSIAEERNKSFRVLSSAPGPHCNGPCRRNRKTSQSGRRKHHNLLCIHCQLPLLYYQSPRNFS